MRKILTALVVTATVATAAVATSSTADARWGRGWGWGPAPFIGGFAAGAIIGSVLAPRPYYYPYGGGYYPYAYRYCRPFWNGWAWVRGC